MVLILVIGGCMARPAQVASRPQPWQSEHEPMAASALAFDPPVALGQPEPDLSRDLRQPEAFAGYQSITSSHFRVRIDDQQNDGFDDRYLRRAIVERVGAVYR